MAEARFDIAAKVPAGATQDDLRVMLQNLLVERFQLKLHHESRETQAYALTVGRDGPRFAAFPSELPEGATDALLPRPTGIDKDGFFLFPPGSVVGMMGSADGQTRILLVRKPVTELCSFLARLLDAPVVDQTGLTGRYDVHLKFAVEPESPQSDGGDPAPKVPNASDPAPELFRALEKQLGLKLERRKLPVSFLVVDSANKTPAEN